MSEQNPFARVFQQPISSVRLAVLKAGKDEPLKVDLIHADPKDTQYDCISYDRSKDFESVDIEVDGQSFAVPKPLEAALRTFRKTDSPLTLWADLLIGSTVEERSTQAAEMATVFESSDRVVAWLGPANEHSEEALEMIRNLANRWHQARLHSNFPEYSNRATQRQMMDAYTHLTSKPAEDLKLDEKELWQTVHDIFNTSYFETTQSIPEIVLARNVVISIGNRSTSWGNFNAALMGYLMLAPSLGFPMPPKFMDAYQRISRLELATNRKKNGESLELLAMIKDARRTSCSDPREIVFSMLPIITPSERTKNDSKRPTVPQVDYSKNAPEIFKEASKYMIEERQDVMLWWNERPPCGRKISNLPSWATDFSAPLPLDGSTSMVSPNNGLRGWAEPLQNKRIYIDETDGLHVQAHALDRIVSVSKIFTQENCRRLCLEEWQKLPNVPNESLVEKVAKVWRALCLNNGGMGATMQQTSAPPADTWISFQSVMAEERIMSLLDCTLDEIVSQSPEIVARARANPDVQTLGPQTGKSEAFEALLRANAIGRRFFQTQSGRVGMTAVEDAPASAGEDDDDAAQPVPNFDEVMGNPFGSMMLAGFQAHLARENPEMARIVGQAMNGTLPRQRAPGVRTGDLVVAVVGGFQPYVLRPQAEGGGVSLDAAAKYTYVGDCYMHGVMDGECFKERGWFGFTRYKRDIETVDITIV